MSRIVLALVEHLLGSIDAPCRGRVLRLVTSARIGLWPAIALSAFSFDYLLQYGHFQTAVLSANLCLLASAGFLFNDNIDRTIDTVNGIDRWHLDTRLDAVLFGAVISGLVGLLFLSSLTLSKTAVISLVGVAFVLVAYSVYLKRLFLLGNLVAAALSLTPGFIMLADINRTYEASVVDGRTIAIGLLAIGLLLLVSREIRFDEFDEVGDRSGNRLTVPMVVGKIALTAFHTVLVVTALCSFVFLIIWFGNHAGGTNIIIGVLIAGWTGIAAAVAYSSKSKVIFYKSTRLVMLVVSGAIFFCF